ncbi:MAG: hypothetical protein D6711_05835 [Chloroflexi bacterium]|nr:MAG: hypothetical protein D6711_05835 [Chloroflexota bacterium]
MFVVVISGLLMVVESITQMSRIIRHMVTMTLMNKIIPNASMFYLYHWLVDNSIIAWFER